MKKLPLLGGLTAAQFMRDYWQQKPLWVRGALPNFQAPLSPTQTLSFANQAVHKARLISRSKTQWQLSHAPFKKLPSLSEANWTVLLSNMEAAHPALASLLAQFGFAGFAQLDDLMISVASKGGGVGPHLDSYNVFLFQAHGQREWKISLQDDVSLQPNKPLKLLKNFQPQQSAVLSPGDMLYLPPGWAHDGVALGECMTYSIGFRAPSLGDYADDLDDYFEDAPEEGAQQLLLKPKARSQAAKLEKTDIAHYRAQLLQLLDHDFLSEQMGCVLTKLNRPIEAPSETAKAGRGVSLNALSRMLYSDTHIFLNGYSFAVSGQDALLLQRLADTRSLSAAEVKELSKEARAALRDWRGEGWLV